jgi:hypothetical protein
MQRVQVSAKQHSRQQRLAVLQLVQETEEEVLDAGDALSRRALKTRRKYEWNIHVFSRSERFK